MAKARKGTRKPVARRSAKKTTRRATAKLKGRRITKPKSRRAKRPGILGGALDVIADTVRLRTRLGRNRFEDQ